MLQAHKVGALFYVLWGLLHIVIGAIPLVLFATRGGTALLQFFGAAISPENLPRDPSGLAAAIGAQHAWNLLWVGALSVFIAVKYNWKNDKFGYWLNLAVVTATDIGFIAAMVIPGYISLSNGLIGPGLWILAVVFSTIGFSRGHGGATAVNSA